jgi:hypothetical protein
MYICIYKYKCICIFCIHIGKKNDRKSIKMKDKSSDVGGGLGGHETLLDKEYMNLDEVSISLSQSERELGNLYLYLYMSVYLCMYIYIYLYIHICIYTYKYIHTYIHM